ncbi:hypothetical protein NPIL_658651 [Nephila pilipes]|uniref:Uncharacterized protein n=1 Tax=Nephila pilipes TaxID=299642 RepID=A0A8X6P6Z4_NEPPI|nr:hypothetical protein NPIL_658651 [Nephila pilipes]
MLHIFVFFKTRKSLEGVGRILQGTLSFHQKPPSQVNPLSSISMIRYTKPGRYSLCVPHPHSIFPGIRFLDMDPVPLNIRSAKGRNPGKGRAPVHSE